MAEPFLSELRLFSFGFPPKGWTLCDGQLLPINQNQALFSLLGTTYGGDGMTNFGLPNLQSRIPVHMGNGFFLGQRYGETGHTLSISELPTHNHIMKCLSMAGSQNTAPGAFYADTATLTNIDVYKTGVTPFVAMAANMVANTGGNQAHLNQQPFLNRFLRSTEHQLLNQGRQTLGEDDIR